MKIKTVFKDGVQRLKEAGIPEPELEVTLLLAHVLKTGKTAILLAADQALNDGQREKFEKYIRRRLAREPLAYITEEKEFWSLPFRVSPDVLIPRPETEFLIEKALEVLEKTTGPSGHGINILDLGTGSGVIAVVLALELPAVHITAVDYSFKALQVASDNATRHGSAERIAFINCDWFGGVAAKARYDMVFANPPYISSKTLALPFGKSPGSLQPEVGSFEPRLALDGGEQGMQAIGNIAAGLEKVLKPGGWFFMEIGDDQAEDVSALFKKTGAYKTSVVHNDYAGRARVFQARKRLKRNNMTSGLHLGS